jgi:predicted short-subunit dehydrogenase-like oxidoreductase (DUF2520 family)
MNIVLLGSGNTATVLAKLMVAKQHSIVQVWSRTFANAHELTSKVGGIAIEFLTDITKEADLYMIAVTDGIVNDIADQLQLKNKIVVHTAGSVSKDVLSSASANYGVLYPLQSLRKDMTTVPEIPFLIDANSEDVKVLLYDFAKELSGSVAFANDEERLHMHLAAVVVNNFTNHLYAIAENLCKQQPLNFQMLLPLIQETAHRLTQVSAIDAQTGPARRGDGATINKHLHLLKENEKIQFIYQTLSNSILDMYHKKEELR